MMDPVKGMASFMMYRSGTESSEHDEEEELRDEESAMFCQPSSGSLLKAAFAMRNSPAVLDETFMKLTDMDMGVPSLSINESRFEADGQSEDAGMIDLECAIGDLSMGGRVKELPLPASSGLREAAPRKSYAECGVQTVLQPNSTSTYQHGLLLDKMRKRSYEGGEVSNDQWNEGECDHGRQEVRISLKKRKPEPEPNSTSTYQHGLQLETLRKRSYPGGEVCKDHWGQREGDHGRQEPSEGGQAGAGTVSQPKVRRFSEPMQDSIREMPVTCAASTTRHHTDTAEELTPDSHARYFLLGQLGVNVENFQGGRSSITNQNDAMCWPHPSETLVPRRAPKRPAQDYDEAELAPSGGACRALFPLASRINKSVVPEKRNKRTSAEDKRVPVRDHILLGKSHQEGIPNESVLMEVVNQDQLHGSIEASSSSSTKAGQRKTYKTWKDFLNYLLKGDEDVPAAGDN